MGFWGVVNNCIKNSDIILLILDARVPEDSRNTEVEKKADQLEKELILVFNKSDLISGGEKRRLKKKYPNAFFVTAHKRSTLRDLQAFLKKKGQGRERALRVSFIGYPNVGKSSLLNTLIPDAHAKVGNISGTTKKTQWVRSGDIRYMDSPGVIPRKDSNLKIGITASKDPHKIQNPERVALGIIRHILKTNKTTLEKFYNIPILEDSSDYDIFLLIGEKKKYLLQKGEIDEHRTAIRVIEDWQKGKISLK